MSNENGLKMNIDEAERKRRSDLAKSLHAKGKFGGPQKGAGRPKKERAREVVADKIAEQGEAIFEALKAGLDSPSPSVRLKAALTMLQIEDEEARFQFKQEQKLYDNLSREKILEMIQKKIEQLERSGLSVADIVGQAKEIKEPIALLNE